MVHLSLAEVEWPEADRALWARLTAPPVPLEEPGALSHLRQSSLGTMRVAYGRWLGWLAQSEPVALEEDPVERATPQRLEGWSRSFAHLAARSRLTFIEQVVRVWSAAAPDADWTAARRLLRRPRHEAAFASSDRKTGRVLSSKVLFKAGLHDFETAEADRAPDAALRRRDGMMVAFLGFAGAPSPPSNSDDRSAEMERP